MPKPTISDSRPAQHTTVKFHRTAPAQTARWKDRRLRSRDKAPFLVICTAPGPLDHGGMIELGSPAHGSALTAAGGDDSPVSIGSLHQLPDLVGSGVIGVLLDQCTVGNVGRAAAHIERQPAVAHRNLVAACDRSKCEFLIRSVYAAVLFERDAGAGGHCATPEAQAFA